MFLLLRPVKRLSIRRIFLIDSFRSLKAESEDQPITKSWFLSYKSTAFHTWMGGRSRLEHKGAFPVRAYPKTGTHWTRAVAFFTTAALLKTIERESGREMPQLSESVESIDRRPDSRPIPANPEQRRTGKIPIVTILSTTTYLSYSISSRSPTSAIFMLAFRFRRVGKKRAVS